MAAKLTDKQVIALAMIRNAHHVYVSGAVAKCSIDAGLDKRGNPYTRTAPVAMRTVRSLEKRGLVETRWVQHPMGGGDLMVLVKKVEV